MLTGRPSTDPPRGDTQGGQPPIIVREGGTNQAAKSKTDVGVSVPKANGLSIRVTVRQEYKTLAQPEQDRRRQNAPWESHEPCEPDDPEEVRTMQECQ